uniref:Insulinase family protein n=2 Tax=Thermorudis TaxID=1649508 RepID=A0A7C2WRR5_9BACT
MASPTTITARLDNGLTVVLRELHRVPVVSCWVWYRVGSRNEPPGLTGISHWVEHMLFKGTPRFPPGSIFREVNRWGGTLNGFTWIDYTAYFETLPNTAVRLALEIESDRMQHAAFDPAEVERERTVILAEREGNENQPPYFLREEVLAAAFRAHPYGQPVIGHRADLLSITRDELYRHYLTFYTPNNATLVLVGDFDVEQMLRSVEDRFGRIPAGPEPPAVRAREPEQWGERRVTVRRPAPTPVLLMAWHAPPAASSDAPALVVLDTVLSGAKPVSFGGGGMGRSSRLYRALVSSGLCSSAASSFALTIDPYLFTVSATLTPTADPGQVEAIVERELARVREEPVPADELARAIRQLRAQFAAWEEAVDALLDELESVTPDELLRVANTYFVPERRTVGWLEPAGATLGAAPPAELLAVRPHFLVDPGPEPVIYPRVSLTIRQDRLANGLTLLGHHDPTSEVAAVVLRLPAGAARDGDRPGTAYLTGQMLTHGTEARSFDALNEELDALGAALSVSVGRDAVDVSATCLRDDLPRIVELLAEVALRPTFPEDELERVRAQALTALRQALNSTRAQADYTLRSLLYPPGHPYHHRVLGSEERLREMTREELVEFHWRYYRPDRAYLAVAGGVPVEEAWRLIEAAFAGWEPGKAPELAIPPVEPPPRRIRRQETLPGKSQADIALGLPTVPRRHPDYETLRLANIVLGRLGMMGRLGASVRERLGLAYYASSTLEAGLGPGLWMAYAGVNPVNIERAIEQIIAEVIRLREEPVDQRELSDARTYLLGGLPLGLETSGAIASLALDLAFYDLGMDYIDRLPDLIGSIGAEQIQEVARRYLDPERMAIAVAGPEAPAGEASPAPVA